MLTMGGPRAGIIRDPSAWAGSAGYEFWIGFGHVDIITAGGATNRGLDMSGWTIGGAHIEGSAGDFLSSSDRDATRLDPAPTTTFISPRIFGSYSHALQAARFLGYFPTKLVMEAPIIASGSVSLTCFIGLATAAVITSSDAGGGGAVTSSGTNFVYTSDNFTFNMATYDAVYHLWRIEWRNDGVVGVYMDDVSQGTSTVETDIWPLPLYIRQSGAVAAHMQCPWARVFYS